MKACENFNKLGCCLKAYCGVGTNSLLFKNVLAPDWWDTKTMSAKEQLVNSLILVIAQRLNVSVKSLLDVSLVPDFATPNACYKMKTQDTVDNMQGTSAFLSQLAQTILDGIDSQEQVGKARTIREKILEKQSSVDLDSLLEYCWSVNIPVVHINRTLPRNTRNSSYWHKPHAMVVRHDSKYCVFLVEEHKFKAKHLFSLAHELGHIALGHLNGNGILSDKNIDMRFSMSEKNEKEANEYALMLLSGCEKLEVPKNKLSVQEIARWAIDAEKLYRINAGYLILQYAKENNEYPKCMKALNMLNQAKSNDPHSTIMKEFFKNFHQENYSIDELDSISKAIALDC